MDTCGGCARRAAANSVVPPRRAAWFTAPPQKKRASESAPDGFPIPRCGNPQCFRLTADLLSDDIRSCPTAMVSRMSLSFPNVGDLLLVVTQLATVPESGGNAEFGQDKCLKHDPPRNNQKDNPDAHAALSFSRLVLVQWFHCVASVIVVGCSSRPRCDYAQEKPPWEAHELPVERLPGPFSEPDLRDANVDITFSLSSASQDGHGPLSSPLLRKQRDSKTVPHRLHLNSKIGIYSSLSATWVMILFAETKTPRLVTIIFGGFFCQLS